MKKQKLIKKQKLKGQLLNKTKNWKNLQNLHYNTSSGKINGNWHKIRLLP